MRKQINNKGKRFKQTFHQRRYSSGKETHKEIFNTISHWGNAN